LIIQANTGGRSLTNGAQLEFVIPGNTDGTNLWGQARIITVAGNTNSSNASGQMILGTRRLFTKGTINSWNYGDDLVINSNGSVIVGATNIDGYSIGTTYKMMVAGKIAATGEVRVFTDGTTVFPDYVFDPAYKLPNLEDIEKFVKENRHLPEVPSAADIEKDGMSLNGMNTILLKKVEELTLYMIEMKKKTEELEKENDELKARVNKLEKIK
jgi:hypothetical protein